MKPLQWQESAAFKRALEMTLYGPQNPWPPFFVASGITILMLGMSALRQQPYIADSWLWTVVVAFMIGFGFVYSMKGIHFISSRLILLANAGLIIKEFRGTAVQFTTYRWDDISHFTIEKVSLQNKVFPSFIAHLSSGERVLCGLGKKDETNQIEAAVRSRGKELRQF